MRRRGPVALLAGVVLACSAAGQALALPAFPRLVAEGEQLAVTGEDLNRRVRVLAALLGLSPDQPGADGYLVRLAAQTVQHLVNLVLLEFHAGRDGVRPDPAEVQRRLSAGVRRAGGEEGLRAALARWQLTVDDLRREVEREVLWDAYLDRLAREAVILEEFARRLYEDNRPLFRIPDRYRFAGVVFRYRKPAEEFLRAVLRGVDFLSLARRVVAQPFLQAQGGDIGWLGDDRLHPWILEQVRRLRVGEVSPVFAGPPGWYVVRLDGVQRGRPLTYEEARPAILEDMRHSSARTDLYILVGRLRRELGVRVLWPAEAP